jgi:hypothetical protein
MVTVTSIFTVVLNVTVLRSLRIHVKLHDWRILSGLVIVRWFPSLPSLRLDARSRTSMQAGGFIPAMERAWWAAHGSPPGQTRRLAPPQSASAFEPWAQKIVRGPATGPDYQPARNTRESGGDGRAHAAHEIQGKSARHEVRHGTIPIRQPGDLSMEERPMAFRPRLTTGLALSRTSTALGALRPSCTLCNPSMRFSRR